MSTLNNAPSTTTLSCHRWAGNAFVIPTREATGANIDFSGYTLHMWIGLPLAAPFPFDVQQLDPHGGYTILPGQVKFRIDEIDLAAWNLGVGSYPAELIASNDGGATTDLIWTGSIQVNSGWLTQTY